MITDATFDFLRDLKSNNNRLWFGEHKSEYIQAYGDMLETVVQLLAAITTFDSDIAASHLDPKSCIMRINRDIRFSKDKSPYKTNVFAFINKGGKKSPWGGYYLHLEPGGSFAGGGIYMPEPAVLEQTRREIDAHLGNGRQLLQRRCLPHNFRKGYYPQVHWSGRRKGTRAPILQWSISSSKGITPSDFSPTTRSLIRDL